MDEKLKRQLVDVLGPAFFNKLVKSVAATKEQGRLRYWQEQLLQKVASGIGLQLCSVEDFFAIFEAAPLQEIPRGPWTREIFLRAIESYPHGAYPFDETPSAWMAEAWTIEKVREEISYELARYVSKNGSMCCDSEYLSFLEQGLTVDQLVELFLYIRGKCSSREAEFRPEFEQAFSKCVNALPPPLFDLEDENPYSIHDRFPL